MIVALGLAAMIAAAWVYTLAESAGTHQSAIEIWGHPRSHHAPQTMAELVVMWTIMMTAMMLPTAWPMILLFVGVQRKRSSDREPFLATLLFLGGYLAAWTGYSLLAAVGQSILSTRALLTPQMSTLSPILGGGLLAWAGIFQWTPFKEACLKYCRSPVSFVATHWREGRLGSLRMGLQHGAYCVGCCWILMLILFVTGVMNIFWMVLLTLLTLAEKVVPPRAGFWLRYGSGIGLVVWGVVLVAG